MRIKKRFFPLLRISLVLSLLFVAQFTANAAVLFSDDFEDGNYTGWSKSGGTWSVVTDGTRVLKQAGTSANAYAYTGSSGWSNYSVQARVKPLSFNGSSRPVGVLARYSSTSNYYFATLTSGNKLELGRRKSGGNTVLASKTFTVQTGTWYVLKLSVSGNTLQCYVNGSLELTVTDSTFSAGKIGLWTSYASAEFDDVSVDDGGMAATPTPTTPVATATPTPTPTKPVVTATPTPTTPVATPTPTPTIPVTTATPTPTTSSPTDSYIYQAENATYSNAVFENKHSGYTGTGYVNYDNATGGYIEWLVSVPNSGTRVATFRFANGTSTNRSMDIYVNGSRVVVNLAFNGTGAWTNWVTQTCNLYLNSGANTIRAVAITSDGGPNVDYLAVSGGMPPPTPTPTPTPIVGDFYVAPFGNDNNPGTFALPFYSLSKAVAVAAPGSNIYLRGGTYNYTATVLIDKKGTPTAPFKVLAYPGEKPILSWANWKPANNTERGMARGLKVTGSYWHFKGFEICYAPDNGVKVEGAHNTFEQIVFHHNGDSGIQIGLNKEDYDANPDPENLAAYNRIINCDSYRNADPATSYENADGFACKLYAGKGNYFYGCRAWENSDDGWDCYQTNYLITIENCWTWHNGDPSLWGLSSFAGDGNGFKLGGDNEPCPILVKNCIAFDLPFGACSGFSDNNNGQGITLYNCLAWKCGRSFNMNQQPHVIKNCADFDNVRSAPRDFDSKVIHEYNSWNIPGVVVDYNDFISTSVTDALAPREADGSLPNNGFGKLKPDSDLIDKGINVGLPYQGAAPDLGAYECY